MLETMSTMVPSHRDARAPDPPIQFPPHLRVTRMYTCNVDVEKYGHTKGCPGCRKLMRGTVHPNGCREHMERLMMQDPIGGAERVVRTETRHEQIGTRNTQKGS